MKTLLKRPAAHPANANTATKNMTGLSRPAVSILKQISGSESAVSQLKPPVFQKSNWEKVNGFQGVRESGQSAASIVQPQWVKQDNGVYFYNNLKETAGIRWYYHPATDKMVFNVDPGNPHAKQLAGLKSEAMTYEQWMKVWHDRDWSEEEVAPPEDAEEEEVEPYTPDEIINLTSNPDICEDMVRLWIKYRADLRFFYNMKSNRLFGIDHELPSAFHVEARALPKPKPAITPVGFLNSLIEVYGVASSIRGSIGLSGITKTDGSNRLAKRLAEMPSGSMVHVSLRVDSKSAEIPGHAVGAARVGSTYHIFDPNTGNFVVGGVERFTEVIEYLTGTDWADYSVFYDIVIPDVLSGVR